MRALRLCERDLKQNKMQNSKYKKPPMAAVWILRKLTTYRDNYSSIEDFEEEYQENLKTHGRLKAVLQCWIQIINMIRFYLYLYMNWNITMLSNYLKTGLRTIKTRKFYSILNISGLALGIAASVLILLYVYAEITYDNYHENVDNIYRIGLKPFVLGKENNYAPGIFTMASLAPALKEAYPEVINAARIKKTERKPVVTVKNRFFYEDGDIFYVDPSLFDIFSIDFTKGDKKSALEKPYSIVITEKTSKKYFGEENPVGKVIGLDNRSNYTITGVVKDVPENTHFKFEMLSSFSTLNYIMDTRMLYGWDWAVVNTYIELSEQASSEDFEYKILNIIDKNHPESLKQSGFSFLPFIQKVTDIHLYSNFNGENGGNLTYIYIFTVIALLILLVAGINYVNLATVCSANRVKEIGIRKVLGASRSKLIFQFLSESILLVFLSLILGFFLMWLMLPVFNDLIQKEIDLNLFTEPKIILGILFLTLFFGILSGSFPAFISSSFNPVSIFAGKIKSRSGKFRNILVVTQFAVSIVLMSGTLIIFTQLGFLKNKSLGFEKEQLLVIPLEREDMIQKRNILKTEMLNIPGVVNVSYSSHYPGNTFIFSDPFYFEGRSRENEILYNIESIDYDYFETYGIRISKGRSFSEDFSDDMSIMINETLARELNWDDPIGKKIDKYLGPQNVTTYQVIGVVNDYHFLSLHRTIGPLLFELIKDHSRLVHHSSFYLSIRILPENKSETLKLIQNKWHNLFPSIPVDYFFLDESFDKLYKSEEQLGKIFINFTLIAIFIGCLGLFGLVSFLAEKRTKEFGVRKVLGASDSDIFMLLSREFMKLVAYAHIVGLPTAYFIMNRWLQNFAYHKEISMIVYITVTAVTLLIAIVTLSFRSLKAARAKPVEALKYE